MADFQADFGIESVYSIPEFTCIIPPADSMDFPMCGFEIHKKCDMSFIDVVTTQISCGNHVGYTEH